MMSMTTETKIPFIGALTRVTTYEGLVARFRNAPNWQLERLSKAFLELVWGEAVSPEWASDDDLRYIVNLGQKLKNRYAAEKATAEWFGANPQYCGLVSEQILIRAFERGEVKLVGADHVPIENWAYSDDVPGTYSDEASSSSREVSPGVYSEYKHRCTGTTTRWLSIQPVEIIKAKRLAVV